jgi:hypothetical protein
MASSTHPQASLILGFIMLVGLWAMGAQKIMMWAVGLAMFGLILVRWSTIKTQLHI